MAKPPTVWGILSFRGEGRPGQKKRKTIAKCSSWSFRFARDFELEEEIRARSGQLFFNLKKLWNERMKWNEQVKWTNEMKWRNEMEWTNEMNEWNGKNKWNARIKWNEIEWKLKTTKAVNNDAIEWRCKNDRQLESVSNIHKPCDAFLCKCWSPFYDTLLWPESLSTNVNPINIKHKNLI